MVKSISKKTSEEKYSRLSVSNFPILKSDFLRQDKPKDEIIKILVLFFYNYFNSASFFTFIK